MSNTSEIYQFKLYIKNISPMIWRRFLIRSNSTLKDLHYIIQIMMGWTNYHLNEFLIKGERYTIPNSIGNFSPNGEYGSDIKLEDFKFKKNDKFFYNYDFTARWEFEVRIEKIERPHPHKTYPICISGSGASPDEECGGPYIFNELRDHWSLKAYDILMAFLTFLVDEKKNDKIIRDDFDISELREACYWLNSDKYERKEINKFLNFYGKKDVRWQEAFAETFYL